MNEELMKYRLISNKQTKQNVAQMMKQDVWLDTVYMAKTSRFLFSLWFFMAPQTKQEDQ